MGFVPTGAKQRLVLAVVVLFGAIAVPAVAAAQDHSGFAITPRAGVTASATEPGAAFRLGDYTFLAFERISPAPSYGASARLARKGSPWVLRATILASATASVLARWDCVGGWQGTTPGFCPLLLVKAEGRASGVAATVGVARSFAAVSLAGARSFASIEVGAKRLSFQWTDAGRWFSAGEHTSTEPTVRAGLGVERAWRGTTLVLELADYVTRFGPDETASALDRPGGPPSPGAEPGRRWIHALSLTLGARLRLF